MNDSSSSQAPCAPRRRRLSRPAALLCGSATFALTSLWLVSHVLMIGWQGRTISVAAAYGRLRIWRWNPAYPSGLIADGAGATMAGWYLPQIAVLQLWALAVASLLATIVLWRRGRRPSPGHCATCGYDLTGNVSGTCPECGERTCAGAEHAESRNGGC